MPGWRDRTPGGFQSWFVGLAKYFDVVKQTGLIYKASVTREKKLKSRLTTLSPLRNYNVNTMHGRLIYGDVVRGV
jgi:hypothetical protein